MTLLDAYNEFLEYKRLRCNKDISVTNYYYHLIPLLKFLGNDFPISDLTLELALEYSDYLSQMKKKNGEKLSKGTIATYRRTLRIFISWLCKKKNLDIDIYELPSPKSPSRQCPIYTDNELLQILSACNSPIKWITTRNQLFIMIMYDSGLRQIEITRLKKSDIDFEKNMISVFGKGDKFRHVPLGQCTKEFLLTYYHLCPYKNTERIFLNDDGKALTGNAIRIVTNRMKKKLGFNFSSHILRHNFATNYLIDKYDIVGYLDIEGLKAIMGHVSSSTTELYIHIAKELLSCRNAPSHLDKIFSKSLKNISKMIVAC